MPEKIHNPVPLFMMAAVLLWLFLFRGFIWGELSLQDDAISYYDHTKFFVDNLADGIYPLWDPVWSAGAPNEFFLRRIGSYNPIYPVMALLRIAGLPSTMMYPVFACTYFFIGMAGFYLLLKRFMKERLIAGAGAALLMFSSFSFVLFGSFIILIFTPVVWFLYFTFSFLQKPQKVHALGMSLCLMILMTTYIPFYGLTLIGSLLMLCAAAYLAQLPRILAGAGQFIRGNKFFCAVCLIIVAISLIPGWSLFLEAGQERFVLPTRHTNAPTENVFGVDRQHLHVGAVVQPKRLIAELFRDWQAIDLGRTYLPVVIYGLLLGGLITRIRRADLVVYLWALFFFLLSLKEAGPIYGFLYERVFIFKYLRNLQFFLLLTFYPAVIWLAVSILKQLKDRFPSMHRPSGAAYVAVFAAVTFHPVWVYSHMEHNAEKKTAPYAYDAPYRPFVYVRGEPQPVDLDRKRRIGPPDYYATSWFADLKALIDQDILRQYVRHKFVVYDRALYLPDDQIGAADMERLFYNKDNRALIDRPPEENLEPVSAAEKAEYVTVASDALRVVRFNANSIELKTDFPERKFLVYNDSYHPAWHVWVDGNRVPLYRSNMAFKGWWVPAGARSIRLQFGSVANYAWHYSLMIIFFSCLAWLIYLGRKEGGGCRSSAG